MTTGSMKRWIRAQPYSVGRPHIRVAVAAGGTTNAEERLSDEPTVVTSYATPEDVTDEALARLRAFLHRLGHEANQGEIGIVVDGHYYGITDYDRR